jgi:probable HAF family extracellular repeat protein
MANALNNSNQVVGWSQTASGAQHAFMYSGSTMQDLRLLIPPLPGITLISAVAIDAAGDIVAYGTNSSGQIQEYYLTPAEVPAPEPSAFVVMGIVIAALAVRHARARRNFPQRSQ